MKIGKQKIHYSDNEVSGDPVVILHGWGCDHTTVRSISKILDSGMRVISIDLPGFGKSDEPEEVWGTEDYADLVWSMVENLNLKNPSFIGHSFGGRTSISIASRYPVKKLVLVDSAGITPVRTIRYYYKVYSYKMIKRLILSLYGEKRGRVKLEKQLQKRGSSDYNSSTPKMRAIMSRCVNEDLQKIMPAIKAPTLLIWGENDTATPLKDARKMEKLIPDAGLVNFPNCGHYSFLDNPIGFRAVIQEFFKPELTDKK
ncbi:MAG: alpha/beta hydrolase [Muribaculaceae bacterium]|nr:alpha/beta hydrolase [Muribaculaceae bacterium]